MIALAAIRNSAQSLGLPATFPAEDLLLMQAFVTLEALVSPTGHLDESKVVDAFDITRSADHVFLLGHLDHPAAAFLIAALDGFADTGKRDGEGAQPVRIRDNLVLPHHAADRGDLGHTLDRLQLGALRLRLVAAKDHHCTDFPLKAPDGKDHPAATVWPEWTKE